MRVAVIGASGFVGTSAVHALRNRGVQVDELRAPRLTAELDAKARQRIVRTVAGQLSDVNAVVNAAGIASATGNDTAEMTAANALLPGVIGEAAKAAGVTRYVHVSSAAVQGRRERLDDSVETAPFSAYSRSKAAGEVAAVRHGPGGTVIYRPPGVQGSDRPVTKSLSRYARSPLAFVARPATRPAPQALVGNVGDAIAFLAINAATPPTVVHHPWEGITTGQLLEFLGGRPPKQAPTLLLRTSLAALIKLTPKHSRFTAICRRLETMWFGQPQAPSWLSTAGWDAPYGRSAWQDLGRAAGQAVQTEPKPVATKRLSVIVLTTVHQRHDSRVFHKEAAAIAEIKGMDLQVVVADGEGHKHGTRYVIYDLGKSRFGRLGRFTIGNLRAARYVSRNFPDVLHIHDPELLPLSWIAARIGARTIYDAHEDVPRDILDKYWVPKWARKPLSLMIDRVERALAKSLDHVIAATPSIARRFAADRVVSVQNYPRLEEFPFGGRAGTAEGRNDFIYVGSITRIRGLTEVVQAMALLGPESSSRLVLAGPFSPESYREELQAEPGWVRVDYRGVVDRAEFPDLYRTARAGIVTFHPENNHLEAQPNKLFEYMAAGLPVIASNFPLWADLVKGTESGILVDPRNPSRIAEAMQDLLEDDELVGRMGGNGRRAVIERFNWNSEAEKLRGLYSSYRDDSPKRLYYPPNLTLRGRQSSAVADDV